MTRTWQYGKKARFAYAGSLRCGGQSGKPSTFALAAFHIPTEARLIKNWRKGFVVRARFSRSRGSNRQKI